MFKANKLIFVGLIIFIAAFWILGKPQSIGLPADPWFQSEVADQERPVLVKFGAEWCGPCRVMDESITHAEKEMASEVKFVRIDVDQNQKLASHYRISSIPRTFLFHHGEIIADQKGSLDTESLKKWIRSSLEKISGPPM